jgi:hypothetical protein
VKECDVGFDVVGVALCRALERENALLASQVENALKQIKAYEEALTEAVRTLERAGARETARHCALALRAFQEA